MYKVYSKSPNGRVFKCPSCTNIHFEYKNLNFNFETIHDFDHTAKYFLKLDGEFWETRNVDSHFRRKIFVPIGHKNFHILLNNEELKELKVLFSNTSNLNSSILGTNDFRTDFCEN